jgi:hypothetical protein
VSGSCSWTVTTKNITFDDNESELKSGFQVDGCLVKASVPEQFTFGINNQKTFIAPANTDGSHFVIEQDCNKGAGGCAEFIAGDLIPDQLDVFGGVSFALDIAQAKNIDLGIRLGRDLKNQYETCSKGAIASDRIYAHYILRNNLLVRVI